MKIVVIGNDIRSVALSRTLVREGHRVVAIPGPQPSLFSEIRSIPLRSTDRFQFAWQHMRRVKEISKLVLVEAPDLAVCLHIESSDAGLTDALRHVSNGQLPVFGPSKRAAQLEVSKLFGLQVARRSGLVVPDFEFVKWKDRAKWLFANHKTDRKRLVLKADGLAGGRGTLFSDDFESFTDLFDVLPQGDFLVQEFIDGDEFAISMICSGSCVEVLNVNFEYKREHEGNCGMNTPGMGTVARTAKDLEWLSPILKELPRELGKLDYYGPLDVSFMLDTTRREPVFLEFTARFGDPELSSELLLVEGVGEILGNVANRERPSVRFNEYRWPAGVVVHGFASSESLSFLPTEKADRVSHETILVDGGIEHCFSAAGLRLETPIGRVYRAIERMPAPRNYRRDIGFDVKQRWGSVQRILRRSEGGDNEGGGAY